MNSKNYAVAINTTAAAMPFRFTLGLILAATLLVASTACGAGSDDRNPLLPVGPATVQPVATLSETPATATQVPKPTVAPSATPEPTATPMPRIAPGPTAEPTVSPPPSPTAAPNTEVEDLNTDDDGEGSMSSDLPPECLTDGSMTESKLITTCSFNAMSLLKSVRADVDFDLGALIPGGPPPGSEIPSIRMQVDRVFPEDFRVAMTGPGGEMFELIFVDGASYINDGTSGEWFKVPQTPEDTAAMLLSLNMVEQQLSELDNQDIIWGDSMVSEDGSEYIVSYQPPAEQAGMQAPPMELHLTVDVHTLLQNSVSLQLADQEGQSRKIAEFQYSEHDMPFTINPPDDYIEAGPSMMPPGTEGNGASGSPSVISLAKNGEGNVEVTFSQPVNLIGEVGLYVVEPSTDGWSLSYLEGSGTEVLTFSAVAPEQPPLIPGESLIVGLTFDSPESDLVGENGRRADPTFDEWVYPE